MAKKQYSTPAVRSHGSMTAVTLQNRTGTFLDFAFSAGTPVSQITLS
jgi:hypothetical protein